MRASRRAVGRGSWPRRALRRGLVLALVVPAAWAALAGLGGPPPPVAAQAACGTVPLGGVVRLAGSPHLFVCGADGLLHWGGDTRALARQVEAGAPIAWDTLTELPLEALAALPVGDPWLSGGVLKWGDPLGLVKWETGAEPVVLHIQCIADVEAFGLDAANYGRFVYDPEAWAQAFGRPAPPPPWAALPSATGCGTPTPGPRPSPIATRTPAPSSGGAAGGSGSGGGGSAPTATPIPVPTEVPLTPTGGPPPGDTATPTATATPTSTPTATATATATPAAPTISAIADRSTNEDTALLVAFTVADADTALSSLVVTAASDNQTLVPDASLVPGGANGARTLTITPAAHQNSAAAGTATITVAVRDPGGLTATDAFVLTVVAVNDPPTFTLAGPPPAVLEDAGPRTVPAFATAISAGPGNESGQALTFVVTTTTNPTLFLASGAPAISAAGTLTYTAAPTCTAAPRSRSSSETTAARPPAGPTRRPPRASPSPSPRSTTPPRPSPRATPPRPTCGAPSPPRASWRRPPTTPTSWGTRATPPP